VERTDECNSVKATVPGSLALLDRASRGTHDVGGGASLHFHVPGVSPGLAHGSWYPAVHWNSVRRDPAMWIVPRWPMEVTWCTLGRGNLVTGLQALADGLTAGSLVHCFYVSIDFALGSR